MAKGPSSQCVLWGPVLVAVIGFGTFVCMVCVGVVAEVSSCQHRNEKRFVYKNNKLGK